ncbi:MAG: hypothetical protein JW909_01455 [Planctomycetes bacterium]|nr:hypothetical protein [Planctomycetota bacterium]
MKYPSSGFSGLSLVLALSAVLVSCAGKPVTEAPTPPAHDAPAGVPQPPVSREPAPAPVQVSLPRNPAPQWDGNTDALASQPYDAGLLETGAPVGGGRNKVKTLFSFEDSTTGTHDIDGKPVPYMSNSDNLEVIYVADNGVTDGRWCARVTVSPGPYGGVQITGDALKGWQEYDYVAIDVFVNEEAPHSFAFEVWDGLSKDYATRCTWEGGENFRTHQGAQTFYYHIARAVRNSKQEGRSWDQLAPEDKIDIANLTKIKLIPQGNKDRSTMYWIDNVRLMQEDAVKPTLNVGLPKDAMAFNFSDKGTAIAGFQAVTPESTGVSGNVMSGGKGWPDLLAGTYLKSQSDEEFTVALDVPDGDYLMWLCAGPVLDSRMTAPEFLLQAGGVTLFSANPAFEEYDGEEYLYRFMWTQYSLRKHALWLDYVDRMFPVHTETVKVTGGTLPIRARNFFISGMILCPLDMARDFERMDARLKLARLEAFEKKIFWPANAKHPDGKYDGDYTLFVPDRLDNVGPATLPPPSPRTAVEAAGTRGQNVVIDLAVAPYRDLGACELRLADLKGPGGTIPASAIKGHFVNYRFVPTGVAEIAMLPSLALYVEKGVTAHFVLWLKLPRDAAPGRYSGEFLFVSEKAPGRSVPVEIEVYPFSLVEDIPASMGMYYSGRYLPTPPGDKKWQVVEQQFREMRSLGLTASCVLDDVHVGSVNTGDNTVQMTFDDTCWKLMKNAGLGTNDDQLQLATYQLSTARNIARKVMPWDREARKTAPVDQVPGCELADPNFKPLWVNALRQYSAFLETVGLPSMVWSVDEPREVPNAWNRTVKDTITYLDWMGEIGMKNRMVTPMADFAGGADNIVLTAHCDVMTPHGNKSCAGLVKATLDQGKILHFYNCGMSRLSWGFMVWRDNAKGRWQWHWCFSDDSSYEGYPGSEWYCPFTRQDASAVNAPIEKYPAGAIYKSDMMNIVMGVNDFAYLVTLEAEIARNRKAGLKPVETAKAQAFLKELRIQIPEFPLDDKYEETSANLAPWRAAIADMLKSLAEKQ